MSTKGPRTPNQAASESEGQIRASSTPPSVTDPHAKPWDTPGLPPRLPHERCANHYGPPGRSVINTIRTVLCAYRDDDPARCPRCHRRYAIKGGCSSCDPEQGGTPPRDAA